jgi:hypothetical protein
VKGAINVAKGIRYGILFGVLLLVGYVYGFFAVGVYFIWNVGLPADTWAWVKLILSSAIYLAIGLAVFLPVLIFSLFLMFRDRNMPYIGLPILITVIYAFLPIPVPGPIDEAIVFALSYWFRVRALKQFSPPSDEEENVRSRRSRSSRQDRGEVIDVEKIER